MLLLIVLVEYVIEYCFFRVGLIVEPLPWPDTLFLSGQYPPPIVIVVVKCVIAAAAIAGFPPRIVIIIVRSVIVATAVIRIKF